MLAISRLKMNASLNTTGRGPEPQQKSACSLHSITLLLTLALLLLRSSYPELIQPKWLITPSFCKQGGSNMHSRHVGGDASKPAHYFSSWLPSAKPYSTQLQRARSGASISS